jgi:hypothetical protein
MTKKRQRDDDYLKCPLTKELIKFPVVLVCDGYSYEKEAIKEWLKTNDTSPVTGIKLESKECIENFLLKDIIRDNSNDSNDGNDSNDSNDYFRCPISFETMCNPVLIITGHTFDKESIQKHLKLKENNTNPLTNKILNDITLIPNNIIKNYIYYNLDNRGKKRKISDIVEFSTKIDNLEILEVVKEMSNNSYEKNHNMYMKICKVVENYIEENNKNNLKNDIINAECIKYIIDIITFYNINYSDCESETCFYECFYVCACKILILLSTKKSYYENKIIDANGIDVIILAIKNNIKNTTILVSMCMILCNFSKTYSKLIDKIIDANGINIIINIITIYDKHIELLQCANNILGNLANTEDNMSKILLAGGIEAIIKTITIKQTNKKKQNNINKVIKSGCKALNKFIVYNNVKNSITFINNHINNIIKHNTSDPYILVPALSILLSLIQIKDNKILKNIDIFFTIIKKYLNNKNNSVQIVSTSFSILYIMNEYNSCLINNYLYYSNICTVIDALKQFPNDQNIQYNGIYIINYYIEQKKIKNDNIIATRDGIYILISAINIHINNTEIVIGALKILNFLLDINDNTIIIKRLLFINSYNGIGIINIIKVLNNLVNKDNNFEDLLFVCLLIEKLCKSSIIYDRIIAGDCLKTILLTIKKHKENKKINVLLELFNKLYNKYSLSDNININIKEIEVEDINTIIYIMGEYENDVSVQITGYNILTKWYRNLSPIIYDNNMYKKLSEARSKNYTDSNYKTFVDLGIFNIIIKAINTYKNNDILQSIIYDILVLYIRREGQNAINKVFEIQGITLLIKEICENSKNSIMINNACNLFAYLCVFPDHITPDKIKQDYFFDKEFIKFAINILKQNENNHACHFLANISWNNDKNINKIVEYKVIESILIIMQNRTQKNNQKWPLILLNNLIINEDNCLEFAFAGGIQIIVNIMNDNKDSKYIHYILKILSRVSKIDKFLMSIITSGGINCLLEFMKTSKISIVHEYVSEIMINLIKKRHINIISETKDKVIEIMKLHEDILTKETLDRYSFLVITL